MAKKSKVARNEQRLLVVQKHQLERIRLKEVIASPTASAEEKQLALASLQKQPRNASATRVRNRGTSDGRPRGYLRKFGLSRVQFREMAHRGELPGVTKSSW